LDPWQKGLERVRQKIKQIGVRNISLVNGVAEKMPFQNETFHLIISNNGLNNVQNLQKTLNECARVAKKNAQLVFTYNTDKTFLEFYQLFRKTLIAYRLKSCLKQLDKHIYSKRKPLNEFKNALYKSGFRVAKIYESSFNYKFVDGTSMFNHFMINASFLPAWMEIVPKDRLAEVFSDLEKRINSIALRKGLFKMSVPFYTIDCRKE
jgi:ubiquinone/menaquinone biosynthesis C-methylase UbiE